MIVYSRPKTIDDVSAQEHTVSVLQKALTSTNVIFCCWDVIDYLSSRQDSFPTCSSMDLLEPERRRPFWPCLGNSLGMQICGVFKSLLMEFDVVRKTFDPGYLNSMLLMNAASA
jgi:hypothetical protein